MRLPLLSLAFVLAACDRPADARTGPAAADSASAPSVAAPVPAAPAAEGPISPGKYGCSETIPRLRDGSYEYDFEPRGSMQLDAGGQYTDPFGNGGTYRYDDAAQAARFTGGALDGATATTMEDEPGRIRVVIPTSSGERRWTCSRM